MPQFDFVPALIQILTITATFGTIFLILLHVFMPKIAQVLKSREILIQFVNFSSDSETENNGLWNKTIAYIRTK